MTAINRSRRYFGLFLLCVFLNALLTPAAMAATEDEGAATEVEGPLILKKHFFSGMKFSLSGSEEKSIFGFFGGLKQEYADAVSENEEALKLAKSAGSMQTLGAIGGFGLVFYGAWQEGVKAGNEVNNLQASSEDEGGMTYIIAGVAVSLVFGLISISKINASAKVYNEGVNNGGESTVSKIFEMPVRSPELNVQGTTLAKVQVISW